MGQKGNRHPWAGRPAFITGLAAILLSAHALAMPVFDDISGSFSDDFADDSAVSVRQNASVGPSLTPGTRLALTKWSWTQSYTLASDTVIQGFKAPGASFNLTQSVKKCSTCFEMVGLWQKEYRAYRDVILGPGAVTATYYAEKTGPESGETQKLVSVPNVEFYPGDYLARTPILTGMVPGLGYTVTFRASFCDDPKCGKESTEPARRNIFNDNAEVAQYEAWLGNDKRASKQVCIGKIPYSSFFKERQFTEMTLEPDWPATLPSLADSRWDFRVMATLNSLGTPSCYTELDPLPDCEPNCTATLWLDSITILAKGKPVTTTCFVTQADCDAIAPGLTPCRCQCLNPLDYPPAFVVPPCGWDSATYYVGPGSYVSPVFDSLSAKTVWDSMFWLFDQNWAGGVIPQSSIPRTPMVLKWRVGNTPDPAEWVKDNDGIGQPGWYVWTIPTTVTKTGVPDQPPPMSDSGSTTLFSGAVPVVGRYFQYEVDFTSHFANGRFPPEQDDTRNETDRNLHAAPNPLLKGVRVYYTPVRGMVVSQVIKPARLKKWGTVVFDPDLAGGGTVQVDVLDDLGNPLFANIPRLAGGFSIAALSPDRYPAIKLRVWLDNQDNSANRPVLRSWGVTWDINPDPLRIDHNMLDPKKGGQAVFTINLNGERDGTLAVFDAAGQSVKILCRCRFPAGVSTYSWNGSNERGETVAPGIYFISLKAKDVNRIGKLVVK